MYPKKDKCEKIILKIQQKYSVEELKKVINYINKFNLLCFWNYNFSLFSKIKNNQIIIDNKDIYYDNAK